MSLRKTKKAIKYSPKKSGTKKRLHKKSHQKIISIENLKKDLKKEILDELEQNGKIETQNKPQSGHVEAGKKWSQSEAGMQWKTEIDSAQKILDERMGSPVSGKFARELASKKRKNPEQSEQFIEEIVQKIIETKNKQPKTVSPVRLIDNQTEDYINESINKPFHTIGGFFDSDSSDDE